ncbi:hypothetical protein CALCODRAFT_496680 [Calocera cornea HHB12733]|uniref:Uncharacterized protein n=1 Tax=Calocera cornea HHB12733 TaxID=1353952 RepID=A0A165FPE0_9BASI|nr:hypothetical protein CALCODRAFT_496680 [Calocera cornea HHB12733]
MASLAEIGAKLRPRPWPRPLLTREFPLLERPLPELRVPAPRRRQKGEKKAVGAGERFLIRCAVTGRGQQRGSAGWCGWQNARPLLPTTVCPPSQPPGQGD